MSTLLHIAVLGACGGGSSVDRTAAADSSTFKVALLTPGPVSDHAWNAGAYQGLLRIRDSLGARISHIQVATPADFEENFRQYGAQGYSLVFGHGFEFQDAASRVGPEYPHTIYITTSGNRVGPNVAPMVFGFEEPSYLAGIVAGTLTRTHVVGTIGGTELPPVKSSFLAFEAGVHAVDPKVKVLRSYIGNWDDASAGKEQALAQIQRGADFIFQNADAAGLGIFQAAKESKGVYVFGSNSNQNDIAPTVTIGSVVIDLPHAFLTVARQVHDQRFTPHVIYLGTGTDVVKLVINPALDAMITQSLRARLESTRKAIESGALQPPRIEFLDTTAAKR
ncbi:MAG TPA: BMP family protein [Gemmatimonadaceae bacterium]|nr:BMP family protein [Gemmatimonadaceae bacterium]